MSDKPEASRQGESATKEEVQRLTEEINQMRELLKQMNMMGVGAANPSTLNTSRQAAMGSDDGTDIDAEVQHGIGAEEPPFSVKVSPQNRETIGGGREKRARTGLEDPDLLEVRSVGSRTGRKRSDTLKPDTMKVFKFDGTDYEIWSKAMGFYLDGAGLWEVVTGEDGRPDEPEELEEWRLVNTKACNVIFSALTRDQQKNVVNCDLAADMWKTLSQIYARKSMINQAHLIQEYEDYHMRRGITMQKYISEIRSFVGKLRGVGVVYPEKSIVLKVLRGLSEEYAVDRKIMFNQENLTFEEVCGRLLSEALMSSTVRGKSGQGSSSSPALANASFGKSRSPQPGQSSKAKEKRCFICRVEGHISTDCPHRSSVPGEKVFICYTCKQPGHKSPDCPKKKGGLSARAAGKLPAGSGKPGGSNLAEADMQEN